jgi:integrase
VEQGRLIGPKRPLKLREIWAIRIRLQLARGRDLALFNLAIDSKLRGCDLVKLQVRDVAHGGKAVPRVTAMQQKTRQPVKFELTDQTREAVEARLAILGWGGFAAAWRATDLLCGSRSLSVIIGFSRVDHAA